MHHRRVPPNLHLDPAVLRATAGAVAALLPVLRVPALDPDDRAALVGTPGGAALLAEHDRILAAVARTGLALSDLVDGLGAVADGVTTTEYDTVRALEAATRVGDR
ncbi:MAG: hypothetical protein QOK35_1476 [Pseudonocardiales bacterium]|nr:hypothetical protein [Pseudonocardiales bacterium]